MAGNDGCMGFPHGLRERVQDASRAGPHLAGNHGDSPDTSRLAEFQGAPAMDMITENLGCPCRITRMPVSS